MNFILLLILVIINSANSLIGLNHHLKFKIADKVLKLPDILLCRILVRIMQGQMTAEERNARPNEYGELSSKDYVPGAQVCIYRSKRSSFLNCCVCEFVP